MFLYIITLTNGQEVRISASGDPTDHPAFHNRVLSVETIGVEGLSLV